MKQDLYNGQFSNVGDLRRAYDRKLIKYAIVSALPTVVIGLSSLVYLNHLNKTLAEEARPQVVVRQVDLRQELVNENTKGQNLESLIKSTEPKLRAIETNPEYKTATGTLKYDKERKLIAYGLLTTWILELPLVLGLWAKAGKVRDKKLKELESKVLA